jgi:hypothetical protein
VAVKFAYFNSILQIQDLRNFHITRALCQSLRELTFNTTSLPLVRALRRKQLIQREPMQPRPGGQERHLLVTPQIDALLDGHALYGIFPDRAAETLIGIFCAGYLMTVSRKSTRAKPDLERLERANEVWAFCIRRPAPGWRILGRFYDRGVFIGLRAWDKRELAGKYQQASDEVIEDWTELFGAQTPLRGRTVDEYVGGIVRDVDEPQD